MPSSQYTPRSGHARTATRQKHAGQQAIRDLISSDRQKTLTGQVQPAAWFVLRVLYVPRNEKEAGPTNPSLLLPPAPVLKSVRGSV
jgi:hypothetical protein